MLARIVKNGKWYDENGDVIPKNKQNVTGKKVQEELEYDLQDYGFEGYIKRFILNAINTSIKGE
ncbi:hypothetical protein [Streptococcus saliviloxodontae]|uniref:Uncharacterized protein n=1 Tax=Streptococcus saliviloxodontae TaxID=1349416 RepID=A0ABS2PIP3_9STRE|nr:hypothetical protein [Streptococcus saliviloxodontae]MBM7635216.1 hypothetical protein [Streptococcus saliviloxodontae]